MGVRRWVFLLLLPLAFLVLRCASATEIDVDIYSEIACDKNAEVGLVMGNTLTELTTNVVTSSADHCEPSTRVGRVVISPSGDNDEAIALAVVTRNDGQGLDTCTEQNNYKGCIVAKRQLHFEPHTRLEVRIDLRLSCLDNPCGTTDTCVKGKCVSATCPNGGCADETVLNGGSTTAPNDGGVAEAGPSDSSTDAPVAVNGCVPTPATKLAPVTIVANAGNTAVTIPTGLAQHHHLVYVENEAQYFYFWADTTPNVIKTRKSCDLVNWSDGPSFPISAGVAGNSANFDVAYLNAGGTDVFHIVLDHIEANTGYTYDLRYKLVDHQPVATAPMKVQLPSDGVVLNTPCFDTDAPSVAIGKDGSVYLATGYTTIRDAGDPRHDTECDMNIYKSFGHETGDDTAWGTQGYKIVGYHNADSYSTNHLLLPLPSGTIYGAFSEPLEGTPQPTYSSIAWLKRVDDWNGAAPGGYGNHYSTSGSIFPDAKQNGSGSGDWGICMLADDKGYAIRHLADGTFDAQQWNGAAWQADGAPTSSPAIAVAGQATQSIVGAGVTILQDGNPDHGMIAVTVDSTGDDHLVWSAHGQAGWSAWAPIDGMFNNQTRRWVASTGCGAIKGPPVLMWTDLSDPTAAVIDMMDVSPLFPAKAP